MLRAAIVGCGFIGAGKGSSSLGVQSHAEAYGLEARARLVALCDPDEERLERAQKLWCVEKGYRSVEGMLAEVEPELVSVCAPDPAHARVLHAVLECSSVRGILAEKPLGMTVAEAQPIVTRAEQRGVVLAVNYVRRYAPGYRVLREWLEQGGVGTIESVSGCYVRGLKHNGTHWIDLARFLIGEIRSIAGRYDTHVWEPDPTMDVTMEFQIGARGTLLGIRTASYSLFEMDIVGSRGRIRLIESGDRFEMTAPAPSDRFPGFLELRPSRGPTGSLHDLLRYPVADLVDSVLAGRLPACTGADGLLTLELAEQAIESARRGSFVEAEK